MKTIYVDSDFRCHTKGEDALEPVETDYFDDEYWTEDKVEEMRFVPEGREWTREDGSVFQGQMVAPW